MVHTGMTFEAAAMPMLDSLYRTAFRMVHDEAAAEHCVERTYLEGQHNFPHHGGIDDLRVWMFGLLFREIHKGRTAWVQVKRWLKPARDDGDQILCELDGMPGMLREAILLVDVEGFNKREAARILEISEQEAAERLAEGRFRLQAALAGGPAIAPCRM
jgi:DNA-directed RNA polymerase specialized sigma24 family protein